MAVELLFWQSPGTGDLVFGEEPTATEHLVAVVEANLPELAQSVTVRRVEPVVPQIVLPPLALAATVERIESIVTAVALPSLELAATLGRNERAVISAVLPGLTALVRIEPPALAVLSAELPGLTLAAEVSNRPILRIEANLPALTAVTTAVYRSGTQRPTVSASALTHQVARHGSMGAQERSEKTRADRVGGEERWTGADPASALITSRIPQAFLRTRLTYRARHAEAARVEAADRRLHSQDAIRDPRLARSAWHQDALAIRHARTSLFQDCLRDRRTSRVSAYSGARKTASGFTWRTGSAAPKRVPLRLRWQEAIRPPAGRYTRPVAPPEQPACYTPNPHLLFAEGWGSSTALLFVCERVVPPTHETVVVPVRRVYMVLNEVHLKRVTGNIEIPTLSLGLTIDAGSWTWGFDATVPAEALVDLEPDAGGSPVELEATINGTAYRLLAERLSRERTFGQSTVKVSGRGKSAVLDAPYAPTMTFTNSGDRTAQQLMADALQVNGVPIGWTIDWGITDWLVPTGVWSHQGTYISALNAIAGAAGAYLQPHRTAQTIRVLPRYPSAPWEWGTVTPDFVLPAAATARESLEWKDAAPYNGVYVSGVSAGILGWIKRTGTAGDVLAPMVVDPLITAATAARQRGIAVLADTGRQIAVNLRLPVLPETGIIEPGAFIEYQDGSVTRLGLVRSTSVQAGLPEVWQTLGVETHA
ncbi:MAG: hypothetical protein IPL06_02675 [Betaproteobacteria bacterium]|nr:hypothetical protein [Betaproteobacteria bacterium]